ncbi:snare region anchored in the vesicle membrane carboxy-terminal protein [Toxoplasma gondii VAND]|uniref:Snare region anchored in the vesicle membrane carboxy-terminal protein n=1 Tax=Toxoplasma gondii VAND TaxID=933077 RepID=A0A086PR07_TOXGO|nr:snare region anchored in the vesicle membrane carboxy-terminal protein [Toxoplasma gondii VAND]
MSGGLTCDDGPRHTGLLVGFHHSGRQVSLDAVSDNSDCARPRPSEPERRSSLLSQPRVRSQGSTSLDARPRPLDADFGPRYSRQNSGRGLRPEAREDEDDDEGCSVSVRSRVYADGHREAQISFHPTTKRGSACFHASEDEPGDTCAEAAEQQLQALDALLGNLARAVEEVAESKRQGADALKKHQVKVQRIQQEIDTNISALDLELRCIASSLKPSYRSSLLAQRQQKQQQAAALGRAYEDAVLSITTEELLAYGAAADEGGGHEALGGEHMRQTLVQAGDEIQDKTEASINRTKHMVGEMEEMGAQILIKMDEQTEQLRKANQDLDDAHYNVDRAKKTAITLAKNAAGDRFSQCLCLFIFLFLVIAIVLVCVPR